MSNHRAGSVTRPILAATVVASLAVGLHVAAAPVSPAEAASPQACRVRNSSKGEGYRLGPHPDDRESLVPDGRLSLAGPPVSRRGGGISLYFGSVSLLGSSTIRRNAIRLEDSSAIKSNVTLIDGGGIRTEGADIVLLDNSLC